jgi:hypothetical protein
MWSCQGIINYSTQLHLVGHFRILYYDARKHEYYVCIWSVAVCGSETWTLGKNKARDVNAFETWSWRRLLKIKWTDRITNGEVFQRANKERKLLKFLKYRRHP